MIGAIGQTSNIAAAVYRHAQTAPDQEALVALDIRLSYRALWQISLVFAARMKALGVGRGTMVFVHSRDAIASVAVMLGTQLLGSRFELYSEQGVARTPTGFLLYSPDQREPDGLPDTLSAVQMTPAWSPKHTKVPDATPESCPGYLNADDSWWTMYTSGTTGKPKALLLSYRMAFDRSAAVRGDFSGAETRFCSLFPCTVRPFFVRAMAALLNGSTIVDSLDPAFLIKEQVTLVAGAPRHATDWAAKSRATRKLPKLQVSGAALSKLQIEDLLRHFDVVEDVYGSSETNKAYVTYYRAGPDGIESAGVPQDSVVEIVDDQGQPCKAGAPGLIRIKNTYSVDHYEDAPEATSRTFRDGWFLPGDRASWSESGALSILGRTDTLLNVDGDKIDPVAIESVLMSVSGVRLAAVFRDPRPESGPVILAAFELEPEANHDRTLESAIRKCLAEIGPRWTPATAIVLPAIPTTPDGTPRRQECAALAQKMFAQSQPPIV